jgi:wyosine [tRNA(Phe)-imidazoG37] synthetase (radical SAM superfamily)
VDLIPYKTCCYDCIYCQLGATTGLSVKRRDFYPLPAVLDDIRSALAASPPPDVITLAGSGEPALYRSLHELIRGIHDMTDIPVVLLTNGGLLFDEDVARAAMEADILAPSLDAGNETTFLKINRPHPEITFERMLSGLRDVCSRFQGDIRLEVMLVRGVNDTDRELEAIAKQLATIRHTSVDINTVVRPAGSGEALACDEAVLSRACAIFGEKARIIADFSPEFGRPRDVEPERLKDDRVVLDLISRRPCTLTDIQASLGLHPNEIVKILDRLTKKGLVRERPGEAAVFYIAAPRDESGS